MRRISQLDTATSAFFSHQDPAMVEWFVKMIEERKSQHDSSKEKRTGKAEFQKHYRGCFYRLITSGLSFSVSIQEVTKLRV